MYRFTSESTDKENRKKAVYYVIIEHYEHNVLVVKYYPKPLRLTPYKYHLIFGIYDTLRIINTVIDIALSELATNPTASFAFIGMPSMMKKDRELVVETEVPTQRFKLYAWYVKRLPQAELFTHRPWEAASAYLLLNNEIKDMDTYEGQVMDMFTKAYDNILDPRQSDSLYIPPRLWEELHREIEPEQASNSASLSHTTQTNSIDP